jgi:hypothetical protein
MVFTRLLGICGKYRTASAVVVAFGRTYEPDRLQLLLYRSIIVVMALD